MKEVLLIFLIFCCKVILGQNLVANPSFEDANYCKEYQQPCSPSAWFHIYHMARGYTGSKMQSANGYRHLTLQVDNMQSPDRDYWQTMLLATLQAGTSYTVSIKVASPTGSLNLKDIGFFFSESFIKISRDSLLQPIDYLSFLDASVKKLRNGWFELRKEFIPSKNFEYLVIGNFSSRTHHQITKDESVKSGRSYIAVDQITISSKKKYMFHIENNRKDSLYAITARHPIESNVSLSKTSTSSPKADTLIINDILFDYNSYVIKKEDSLNYLGSHLLDATIKRIRIVGYTDNKGPSSYNQSLSLNRAEAVSRYIKQKFHIQYPAEVEGKGMSDKYLDRQQNRRVEIWIYR